MERKTQKSDSKGDPGRKRGKKQKSDSKGDSGGKRGRVFIRNLIFDVNKRLLTKLFKKFGEIVDINIPLNPKNNLAKGFAFVQFKSKNSALKAIKELNNTIWKTRKIQLKMAVDKRMYKEGKKTKNEKKEEKVEIVKEEEEKEEEQYEEDEEMAELDNIVLQNIQNLGDEFEFEEEEDDFDENGMMEEELEFDDEENQENEDQEEETQENEGKEKEGFKRMSKGKRMQQQNEDLTCTVFVRGVPYETLENEFETFCKEIGELEYAKLVKMKDGSGRHNGNAFIKFKDGKAAQKVIIMTEKLDEGNYIPSLQDPDIYISGTRLKFFPAITKKKAMKKKIDRMKEIREKEENKLADQGTNQRKTKRKRRLKTLEELIDSDKKGKRRLEFSVLGFNILDEQQSKGLRKIEVLQREDHMAEKIEKMKNPNMSISQTRILFKNIDKFLDEDKLGKKIKVIIANEKFKGEKKKKRNFLKKKKIFKKIVILTEEAQDGKLTSKGIAFVEFITSDLAEEFLRLVDNSKIAKLFSESKFPIIEFAFEDIRQLRKIQNIREKRKIEEDFLDRIDKPFNSIKRKEDKKLNKKKEENAKSLVKARMRDIRENPQNYGEKQLKETYKMVKSRGLKQRFRKLVKRLYPELKMFQGNSIQKKPEDWDSLTKNLNKKINSKGGNLKKRKPPKRKDSEEDETIYPRKVKKKKKKNHSHGEDKLDNLAKKYIEKKQKALKWDKN